MYVLNYVSNLACCLPELLFFAVSRLSSVHYLCEEGVARFVLSGTIFVIPVE